MVNRFSKGSFSARRSLLLATILAAGSCGLWAQAGPPGGPPPDGQMRRGPNTERELGQLTQALSLTPDQQTQVKGLLEQRRGKMDELRGSGTPPTREQMEGIRKDTDAKISALLNDDQKAKFAEWQKQRMERRRGPGGPGGDGPPPPPQPQPPNA